ncbi:MAG: aminomethyl-transferring glycine dehydrogenase [Actinobacteria bacterium]|uniref:glycine dehydrogenase (aminomethyl-transferring) n=1 Tax=freshwater metagenome TaxID=449393 RepID=A0A6J7JFR5_9ZZZZ|nr:aminomethyl-transferring glycine dehydrogenase [Actinomycetota bacterium]
MTITTARDALTGDDRAGAAAPFVERHIGPDGPDVATMLEAIGHDSLESLVAAVVPELIRWHQGLSLPPAASEWEATSELRAIAARNNRAVSMIGLGYHMTRTPAVLVRNILESPSWYTAYTPYQPEISQGRLEALLNFQTMVCDLTGLPISGASLLDEPTAAAEAMTLLRRSSASASDVFVVDADTLPQTLAVLATRAEPLGITLRIVDFDEGAQALPVDDFFGVLLSQPGASGTLRDDGPLVEAVHSRGALVAVATDLLALTLLRPPGELGADVAIGSAQRFGVPMGFGGPHAGFMAVRSGLERSMPGRMVGVSIDATGGPAMRLALQTREQHIRREKATSNICTAQVLLAVVASMYAAYHGPRGLTAIARGVNRRARQIAQGVEFMGCPVRSQYFFDTVSFEVPGRARDVVAAALARGINLWHQGSDVVTLTCDEVTSDAHVIAVLEAVAEVLSVDVTVAEELSESIPPELARTSDFLTHPVFNTHHSETEMMRYLRRLSDKDVALDRSMIPLGSCTMKLNAAAEMAPIIWPEFADIHPFAPLDQVAGHLQVIRDLEAWLVEITGYDAISLQPNAGSQGEFAGLLAIRAYHRANGESGRDVCLIPSSAHGTNAASAVMVGMRVVVVSCAENGDVDLDDLREKIEAHRDRLAALMITYPSTHGVFEQGVSGICAMVHDAGGQVYVDGANLNALVGLAKPGRFGADVSHLNLHKTFCIPHGGGGPGVGPVGVRAHLAPYLPSHPLRPEAGPLGRGHADGGVGPVSGAPWGSAGILPIPWAYIRMMGGDGLTRATSVAILSANYIAVRLRDHFPVLYSGEGGLVAHECILDLRGISKESGVTVDDVAKRLIDYGFHAPTMSFPVTGTLMVEPTESESLEEIDRFCAAMIAIRGEIDRVIAGEWPVELSPLRQAPHTAACVVDEWAMPYSRELAVYPVASVREDKYWPPVRRIDSTHGDRNLVCNCPPPEAFEER